MVPIGTVIAFYGSEDQLEADGAWRVCDGSQLNRREFEQLFEHMLRADPDLIESDQIFRLPDLRGVFLRGLNAGGHGRDPEQRLVGDLQHDSTEVHSANVRVPAISNAPGSSNGLDGGPHRFVNGYKTEKVRIGDGSETRPVNVAVTWIIRARA